MRASRGFTSRSGRFPSVDVRPRRGASSLPLIILIVVVLTGIVGAVLWYTTVHTPAQAYDQLHQQVMLHLSGLGNPTSNHLDARFTDADGDLVADPPADAKDQIDPDVLTFSYVAVEDPEGYKAAFADFLAYLSKATGKKVEYSAFTSTEDQLKALRDGKLHIAGLNTGNVPIAVNACGFVPVSTVADEAGKSTHEMEIIVPADSSIKTAADLKGKELTLTEASSNSGFKAPLVLLKSDFGLLPGRDYAIRYSLGHDQSIKGIADKKYQAAAVANDVLKRAINNGTIKQDQFRSIYKSEKFPSAGFGYVYNLKPELAAKVRDALLKFDWKGTSVEKEFAPSGQSKFVPVSYKDDWSLIRRIDDQIGYVHQVK